MGKKMLSVRLNSELEQQLELLAAASGLSKNQMVVAALEQFLKTQALGSVPLAEQIREAGHDSFLFHRRHREGECKNAVMVADWARAGGIWTAKNNPSGDVTGAIHGRNLVVGYAWTQDEKVTVISRHLSVSPSFGADAYSHHITSYEIWSEHMRYVPTAKK